MSANILDRIREFGVMHAIGAQPKAVRRIVIAEGVFLAVVSCVLAIGPALALTRSSARDWATCSSTHHCPTGSRCSLSVIWVGLAVLGAMLATDAAAARASRLTVREALAYV